MVAPQQKGNRGAGNRGGSSSLPPWTPRALGPLTPPGDRTPPCSPHTAGPGLRGEGCSASRARPPVPQVQRASERGPPARASERPRASRSVGARGRGGGRCARARTAQARWARSAERSHLEPSGAGPTPAPGGSPPRAPGVAWRRARPAKWFTAQQASALEALSPLCKALLPSPAETARRQTLITPAYGAGMAAPPKPVLRTKAGPWDPGIGGGGEAGRSPVLGVALSAGRGRQRAWCRAPRGQQAGHLERCRAASLPRPSGTGGDGGS